MPPIVIPDTVQARYIWTLDGIDHAVNVVHYHKQGVSVVDQALAQAMADDAGQAWAETALNTHIANNFALTRVTLRDINEPNLPEWSGVVSGVVGACVSDVLPLSTSLVVTLRTAKAGRSFRGRIYQTGYCESANGSTGTAIAGAQVETQDFWVRVNAQAAANGLLMAVASRVRLENNLVQQIVVRDGRWDTQRRRNVPGI